MPNQPSKTKSPNCKCQRCGKEFYLPPSQAVNRLCCSRKCHGVWSETFFWDGFNKVGECHVWQRGSKGKGYGAAMGPDGIQDRTHRIVWRIKVGPIPEGMHVLHMCDNPSCGNIDHLFLGTNDDNVRDKVSKLRQARYLDPSQVKCIRAMYCPGITTHKAIGKLFGISRESARDIINGKHWAHLK